MKIKLSIEQVQNGLIFFVRASIILALFGAIINGRWALLFSTLLILVLTFIPLFFEKKYRVNLPIEIELVIIMFLYASLFLGEIHDYYTLYWWWDVLLHVSSGIVIGFAGFLLMYILDKRSKIKANPLLIVIFAFAFSVAFGALWEIFEFAVDQLFGFNMQRSGLVDTMWDLIVDTLGAFITSFIGYFYLRGKKTPFFTRFVDKFYKENPKYFE